MKKDSSFAAEVPERTFGYIVGLLAYGFPAGMLWGAYGMLILPFEGTRMNPSNPAVFLLGMLFMAGLSQFTGPVAGYLSDHSQHDYGRRRPFFLAANMVGIPGLFCQWIASTHQADFFPSPENPTGRFYAGLYVVAFFISMTAFNVQNVVIAGLLSDLIPQAQVGTANGVLGFLMLTGSLASCGIYNAMEYLYDTYPDTCPSQNIAACGIENMYLVFITFVTVGSTITLIFAKETPLEHASPWSWKELKQTFSLDPVKHHDFYYVTVSRTFYYCALSTQAFLQYYFRDVVQPHGNMLDVHAVSWGGSEHIQNWTMVTGNMSILSLAAGALSSYPFGVMSDHMGGGRKTLICVSCAGMALCFGILAFLSELNHVLIFAVLWGAFNGIFYSVDYAIALDTLPNKLEAARFLGIWGVSSFVGTTLGPVVGGTVLIVFGQWLEPGATSIDGTKHYSHLGFIGLLFCGVMWYMFTISFIRKVGTQQASEKAEVIPLFDNNPDTFDSNYRKMAYNYQSNNPFDD